MNDLNTSEDLIAYCGLHCGDCHGYQQKVPDLARDLRKELRKSKYKEFAYFLANQGFGKEFSNYDQCYEVLGAMLRFRCHKGCRAGGGSPFCKIRQCCQKTSILAVGSVLSLKAAPNLFSLKQYMAIAI